MILHKIFALFFYTYCFELTLYTLMSSVVSVKGTKTRVFQGKLFRDLEDKKELFHPDIPKGLLDSVVNGTLKQPLDHFDTLNTDSFEQRYFYNKDYLNNGSDTKYICVMVGGEAPVEPAWLVVGEMMRYAKSKTINCLPVTIEHRFFGESHPLNTDASTETLRFLTIPQACEDFAKGIQRIKYRLGISHAKVILFGGSYPGSLAAYLRLKFPHIFQAAVASSAPVDWKPVYPEYFQIIGRVIKGIDLACYNTIENGFKILENSTKLGCAGACPTIDEKFKVCNESDKFNSWDADNLANFISNVAGTFAYIGQYNGLLGDMSLEFLCESARNLTNGTDLDKLALMYNKANDFLGIPCTYITFKDYCDYYKETSWGSSAVASGSRTWIWLVCTQIGSLITQTGQDQPFGTLVTAKFLRKFCDCAFGGPHYNSSKEWLVERVKDTRLAFGAKKIGFSGSNVVFVNGRNDPWSALGLIHKKEASCENEIVYIEGASHCNDMVPAFKRDSVALKAARDLTFQAILKYLGLCESSRNNWEFYC